MTNEDDLFEVSIGPPISLNAIFFIPTAMAALASQSRFEKSNYYRRTYIFFLRIHKSSGVEGASDARHRP